MCFWSGFWSGGEVWCVGREMMRIIFGWESWLRELGKQIGNGGQSAESEERRGGTGRVGVVDWGGTIQRIESVDNFRAHIIIQL